MAGDLLVINADGPETRVALIEKGQLVELYIERRRERGIVGNIYKGRVKRVLPGMQASIDAGALRGLTLSYQERRIYHLHEHIDRAIGAELLDEDLRVPALLGSFVED